MVVTGVWHGRHKYTVSRPLVPLLLVVAGSFFTGLISVGIGETAVAMLRSSCKLPLRVAAATSVFVVTVTVLTAALADIAIQGIDSVRLLQYCVCVLPTLTLHMQVPWSLVMWTMPGVLIGGQIGPYVSSKVSSYHGERALIALFVVLGVVMAAVGVEQSVDRWG